MVDPRRGKGQGLVARPTAGCGLDCMSAWPRWPLVLPPLCLPEGTSRDRPRTPSELPPAFGRGGHRWGADPGVLLAADEKSGGRSGVQTDPGLQLCPGACVCMWVSSQCVFTPHLPEEGPLCKTVYLPTCRVFAKTTILKDVSPSSVGAGTRGSLPGGHACHPPGHWGLRSIRPGTPSLSFSAARF